MRYNASNNRSRAGRHFSFRVGAAIPPAIVTGLTGCTVGPDFISPPKPDAARFTAEKLPAIEEGTGNPHLVFGQDIPERWWQVFHNKALNDLVEASIKNNPTLPAAEAAIKVAFYNA